MLALIIPVVVVAGGVLYLFPSLRPDLLENDDEPEAEQAVRPEADALIDDEFDHEDIDAVRCTLTTAGMTAVIDLTNRSDRTASYSIGIAFESPDGTRQLDTTSAMVSSLEPGQTVTEETGAYEDVPSSGFRCRVTSFLRSPP